MDVKAGTRLRCEECGSEFIVVKAEGPALQCCGKDLVEMAAPGAASGTKPS